MVNRRRAPARGTRRATDWLIGPGASATLTEDVTTLLSGIAVASGTTFEQTIVRIRGSIVFGPASGGAFATTGVTEYAGGLYLASDIEVAGTIFLNPLEGDVDDERWMWLHYGVFHYAAAAIEDMAQHFVIDSKAMRKWDENQTLVMVLRKNLIAGAAGTLRGSCCTRVLVKQSGG